MTDARKNEPILHDALGGDSDDLGFTKIEPERLSKNSLIKVDYERYARFLDDSDASDADKREFVQTVWNIVFSIASLGFEAHPVQVIHKICGKSAFREAATQKSSAEVLE